MANGRKTGGRTAGTPNKFSADIKAMVIDALHAVGGTDYLARCAAENPGPFLALLGRIMPTQVSGHEGGAIEMIITGVRRSHEIEAGELEALEPPLGFGRD